MFKNYFIIALRNLRKQKGYSIINIFGLAIGLATCLLITLYVTDELSYDRYVANANRIYRINTDIRFILFFIDKISNAPHLINELTLKN